MAPTQITQPSPAPTVHDPASVIQLFADSLRLERLTHLTLRGVYAAQRRAHYHGYFYDRLVDAHTGRYVRLKVPEAIRPQLLDQHICELGGSMDMVIRSDGVVEPQFVVSQVQAVVENTQALDTANTREGLKQKKTTLGLKPVDSLLIQKLQSGQLPRIALICGVTSIIVEDVKQAMGDALNYYQIEERRINLTDAETIHKTLTSLRDEPFDAIAVARGGGPGLEVFNHVGIAQRALDLQPALLTAIGHAEDVTLLEEIADKRFITPTALGVYLKDLTIRALQWAQTMQSASTLQADLNRKLIPIEYLFWVILWVTLLSATIGLMYLALR